LRAADPNAVATRYDKHARRYPATITIADIFI
jgi:hypothetical protein